MDHGSQRQEHATRTSSTTETSSRVLLLYMYDLMYLLCTDNHPDIISVLRRGKNLHSYEKHSRL
jgi:hypothetical protein